MYFPNAEHAREGTQCPVTHPKLPIRSSAISIQGLRMSQESPL